MLSPRFAPFTLLIGSPFSFELGHDALFFLCTEHAIGALLPQVPEAKDCFGTRAKRLHNVPRLHVLSKQVERIGSHVPVCQCRVAKAFARACSSYRLPSSSQTVYFRRVEHDADTVTSPGVIIRHDTLWREPPFSLKILHCRQTHPQAFRHLLTVHESS